MRQNYDLQAIGLWTGIRGNGYVILDIDAELKIYEKLWGEDLKNAPKLLLLKRMQLSLFSKFLAIDGQD